jgi:hypothetical protein
MRMPLEYKIERDKRKHILFLGDLFAGSEDRLLTSIIEEMNTDFYCMYRTQPKGPNNGVDEVRLLSSLDALRPDFIVAHGTAATIAAQITDIPKLFIKPCFDTSYVLDSMIEKKAWKARIELCNGEKKEFLTVSRQMVIEYRQLEHLLYVNCIHDASTLFFESDIDTDAYNNFLDHFGSAVIIPDIGESSPEAVSRTATFIRGLLAVEEDD